jgi:thioredoxin 1
MAEPKKGANPVVSLSSAAFADWTERRVPLTLVMVGSRACAQSVALEPVLADVGRLYSGKVRMAKLDMDESRAVAKRHKVEAVPTFLMFREGRQVGALAACSVSALDIGKFIRQFSEEAPPATSA